MGRLEQWEKDLLEQVEQKEVQSDPSGNGGGCCCLGAVLVLLVVLALAVQSWAACYPELTGGYSLGTSGKRTDCFTFTETTDEQGICAGLVSGSCPAVYKTNGDLYCTGLKTENRVGCTNSREGCPYGQIYLYAYYCNYSICCSDSTEADSVQCVNDGETWNPSTRRCEKDPCEGYEDYLQDIKNACRQNGGTDDFELVRNSDGTCGTSGFCDLCTDEKKKSVIENARKTCCELGSGFNSASFNFSCKTTIDGLDKTWDYTYKGCDYNFSVNVGANGSSVAAGCGPENSGSSDSQGGSSGSESGGSSDSQGGSSGSEGGETPSDTTGVSSSSISQSRKLRYADGEWCNGSTCDSDSYCLGSNPSSPAHMPPLSRGLGRGPLKAETRVRIPSEVLKSDSEKSRSFLYSMGLIQKLAIRLIF